VGFLLALGPLFSWLVSPKPFPECRNRGIKFLYCMHITSNAKDLEHDLFEQQHGLKEVSKEGPGL
jgi:hypothetical protein